MYIGHTGPELYWTGMYILYVHTSSWSRTILYYSTYEYFQNSVGPSLSSFPCLPPSTAMGVSELAAWRDARRSASARNCLAYVSQGMIGVVSEFGPGSVPYRLSQDQQRADERCTFCMYIGGAGR
jgi:hypothetical protein